MEYSKIDIPRSVEYIINRLNKEGYEAYIVGGCVRDSLMNRAPSDWDITTSAQPDVVKGLFSNTYDTGIKHGTVTVIIENMPFEITTYRIEGKYNDFRRPSEVKFTRSIIEDLKRRDFTINAIAYNNKDLFIDPFNGLHDINNKKICCVGDADGRFQEDALRMLRAVRFSAQLNFIIDGPTLDAIRKNGHLIQKVSIERIRDEINKTLLTDMPGNLILLHETILMQYVLPEFDKCLLTKQGNPYHIYNVGMHSLKAVSEIEKNSILRWTMLLHDIGKPLCRSTDEKGIDHFYGHDLKGCELAGQILTRLKFDNQSINKILRLIKWHDRPIEPTHKAVRKALKTIGDDIFIDLLKIKNADIKAQNPEFLEKRLVKLELIKTIYNEIKSSNQCISKEGLAINGHDLLSIGIKEGKTVGIILDKLLDLVIDNPDMNEKEKLLNYTKGLF